MHEIRQGSIDTKTWKALLSLGLTEFQAYRAHQVIQGATHMKGKLKWAPLGAGIVTIEKFAYSHTGELCMALAKSTGLATLKSSGKRVYEGRIVLNKRTGVYAVQGHGSTQEITDDSLLRVRDKLQDYFLSVRLGHSIPDIAEWEKILLWYGGSRYLPERRAVLRDAEGRIQKMARWNPNKEAYERCPTTPVSNITEPYTEERWQQVQQDYEMYNTLLKKAVVPPITPAWTDKHRTLIADIISHLATFHDAWEKLNAQSPEV